MSMLLCMVVTLSVLSADAENGQAERLYKNCTAPLGQKHPSTQVEKCQEPADAGSGTAERAGFEPTVGLLPRGFSKAVL